MSTKKTMTIRRNLMTIEPDPNIVALLETRVAAVHPRLSTRNREQRARAIAATNAYRLAGDRLVPNAMLSAIAAARRIDRRVVDALAAELAPMVPSHSDAEQLAQAEARMRAMG